MKLPIAGDWTDRAPRYTFRPDEDQLLRFSRTGHMKKITKTEVLNVSETGMAFRVDGRAVPHLGEIIKVELKLPNSDSFMVRMARVVRLESPDGLPHDIQVAVEFIGGSESEKEKLRSNLNRNLMDDFERRRDDGIDQMWWTQMFYYVLAIVFIAFGFYIQG